ncbi:MAG TPA: hypothetical protein VGQ09_21190 [Chitinophagaceae bacterium]|jgi:hypothetical protein|nr:hypothetical protein [Chitinophagaceae bacterium]
MIKDIFLKQLNQILIEFEKLKASAKYEDLSDIAHDKVENLTVLLTKAKATIARVTGTNSEYYKDILSTIERKDRHEGTKLRLIVGTVSALKSDLESGYLKSLHDIIQTEVFSDYLDMADYLISVGLKDPSAVIIGSTLEIQLRDLCKTNSIDTEIQNSKGQLIAKKADTMNADLTKKSIYSSVYQKQITAWLHIRNSAAHGNYNDYTIEEIKLMLQGVRQFILSTS